MTHQVLLLLDGTNIIINTQINLVRWSIHIPLMNLRSQSAHACHILSATTRSKNDKTKGHVHYITRLSLFFFFYVSIQRAQIQERALFIQKGSPHIQKENPYRKPPYMKRCGGENYTNLSNKELFFHITLSLESTKNMQPQSQTFQFLLVQMGPFLKWTSTLQMLTLTPQGIRRACHGIPPISI